MMAKWERFGLGLLLAPVAPLAGLMLCWWATVYFLLPEKWIIIAAFAGLLAGIGADVLFLKKLLERRLGWPLWMAVYLFYSTGLFGMFMGVPVFNTALAVPAGFVVGSRLAWEKAEHPRVLGMAKRAAWFTTAVLVLVCMASAILALLSPSTPSDLKGMLGLDFEVTQGMIIALILIGGVGMLFVCWGLTVLCVRLTHRFLSHLQPYPADSTG